MPNEVLDIAQSTVTPHHDVRDGLPLLTGNDQVEADIASFSARLLGALAAMAVRSKRRQADLAAALSRSGLQATAEMLTAALHHLEQQGCIEDLVPLYDGGVLMSVTTRGIEHLNTAPRWTTLDGASFRVT
jgi:hypothetical protein